MKKGALPPKELPELFGPESLQEFLFELDQLNEDLLYRDPTTEGWVLVRTLSGEGEAAPELFRIYGKDSQKSVVPSDFVNQSAGDSAAAIRGSTHDPHSSEAIDKPH